MRPNLQAAAIFPSPGNSLVCSTGFNVVSPDPNKLNPEFLYYFLISEQSRQYLESVAKGVGYPAVDYKDFDGLRIPLPTLEEQEAIVTFIKQQLERIEEVATLLESQLGTLDVYRRSLIFECVTGKRRISISAPTEAQAHV